MPLPELFSAANPVFAGGFGLAVLASGAQILRLSANIGVQYVKRHFLVSMEVTSKDRSYSWVLQWLYHTQRNSELGHTQHISVETSISANRTSGSTAQDSNVKVDFLPSPGQHILYYGGKYLMVQRIREQSMMDLNSGKPWEKIQLTALGRSTDIFQKILADAVLMALKQEEGKTIIYTNWGSEWRQFGSARARRSLDSVILDSDVKERVLNDVLEWQTGKQWYADRGIPYRRGYLLHGPPGGGKTSFIMALAGKIGYNICILNLAERGLTDDRLALALSTVPPQSLVLLEDVDAAFPSREAGSGRSGSADLTHSHSSDVTFSGLLNVLDGAASSEERLVFMTTNYIDRLDPALIRPGRVDLTQCIDNASDVQIINLYRTFFPDERLEKAQDFLSAIRAAYPMISMAALQGHLLVHKSSPARAIESLPVSGPGKTAINSDTDILLDQGPPPTYMRKVSGRRVLTREQVDQMYFNPQPGWDKDIVQIK